MSNVLHDAYAALLSGITYRTGKEIHWHDEYGTPITVEPIDVESESYVVRSYREDGSLRYKTNYLKEQRHGKSISLYEGGCIWREFEYRHGQLHGKHISWFSNGCKRWEVDFRQGQRHGKDVCWYYNGNKKCEEGYYKGKRHGKNIWWFEDGTLRYEQFYINGNEVTSEEWLDAIIFESEEVVK